MPNESNLFSTHFHLGILAILVMNANAFRIQEFCFYFLNEQTQSFDVLIDWTMYARHVLHNYIELDVP